MTGMPFFFFLSFSLSILQTLFGPRSFSLFSLILCSVSFKAASYSPPFPSLVPLRNKDLLKESQFAYVFLAQKWLLWEDQGILRSLIWEGVINKLGRFNTGYNEWLLPIKLPAVHVIALTLLWGFQSLLQYDFLMVVRITMATAPDKKNTKLSYMRLWKLTNWIKLN